MINSLKWDGVGCFEFFQPLSSQSSSLVAPFLTGPMSPTDIRKGAFPFAKTFRVAGGLGGKKFSVLSEEKCCVLCFCVSFQK